MYYIRDAFDVAEYVISHCKQKGSPISNLKLQKMLYFIQAQFLVSAGRPCFYNKIVAWSTGPYIPDVYEKYRFFGSNAICHIEYYDNDIFNEKDREMVNWIIDKCNQYSNITLMELTQKQTPWIKAICQGEGTEITNESIKEFFSN